MIKYDKKFKPIKKEFQLQYNKINKFFLKMNNCNK